MRSSLTTPYEGVEVAGEFRSLRAFLRECRRNKLVVFGGLVCVLFVLIGAVGLMVLYAGPLQHLYLDQDLPRALRPPLSEGALLGTDALGRDLMWNTIAGVGVSLVVAVSVTLMALVVGIILGSLAGYYGGRTDVVISAVIDLTWSFPVILLAVVLSGVFQPGLPVVMLAVAVILWAGFGRIVRGEVQSLRQRDFIKAARALGVSDRRILLQHLVPNLIVPILVMGSYYVPLTIIAEASLSFIGLGAQPPTPSIGALIANGRQFLGLSHWVVSIPGTVLAIIVIGLNALGDGLRDVLDPRLRSVR